MKILAFILEDFMRVRVVEIRPTGRVTTISGRNGQGKTSTLMGLFATLQGKAATPDKPVRKGAKSAKGQILLGDADGEQLLIERIINPDRSTQLQVRPARNGRPTGEKVTNPQSVIDKLFQMATADKLDITGREFSRDPLEFMRMDAKEQVQLLRSTVKLVQKCPTCKGIEWAKKIGETTEVEGTLFVNQGSAKGAPTQCPECLGEGFVPLDVNVLTQENVHDFEERRQVNVEVRRLMAELGTMVVQEGLPTEKVDEAGPLARLNGATESNKAIERVRAQNAQLERDSKDASRAVENCDGRIVLNKLNIEQIELALREAKDMLISNEEEREDLVLAAASAQEKFNNARNPDFVDVSALSHEWQQAQLVNREIDRRVKRDKVLEQLRGFERDSSSLTRRMEEREERKATAMREAKMPIEGLVFDEKQVTFKGIPLKQLGEAEQLRVSAQIMMAGNPSLRVLPIWRGEALDDENIEMLRNVAEEQDFDVWMVRVGDGGSTAVVIEDGEVRAK